MVSANLSSVSDSENKNIVKNNNVLLHNFLMAVKILITQLRYGHLK